MEDLSKVARGDWFLVELDVVPVDLPGVAQSRGHPRSHTDPSYRLRHRAEVPTLYCGYEVFKLGKFLAIINKDVTILIGGLDLAVLLFSDVILLVVVDDEVVLAVQPAVLEGLDGEPVGALVLVRGAHQEGAGVVHREGEKLLGLRAAYLAKIPPEIKKQKD